jgi:hypothetical protein
MVTASSLDGAIAAMQTVSLMKNEAVWGEADVESVKCIFLLASGLTANYTAMLLVCGRNKVVAEHRLSSR